MGKLELSNLSIAYNDKTVIEDLSFTVQDGELFSLLGPSGVGKTTLLKTIAGLLPTTSGRVIIDGKVVNKLPAEKRDAVLIFQKPLLFPFLNVYDNIAFGLKMLGMKGTAAAKKISTMLSITELQGLQTQNIHQLSGGQQQRVALCRALVLEPSVLLLDEPLSNLDSELRGRMRELIQNVQARTGTTMLFVTHDQKEAFTMSDKIGLLGNKLMLQQGSPRELYHQPLSPEVARFFGNTNFISFALLNSFRGSTGTATPPFKHSTSSEKTAAVIRPEDIIISSESSSNNLGGTVLSCKFEGAFTRIKCKTEAGEFFVLHMGSSYQVGDHLFLYFPPEKIHIFPSAQ
jgi:spermidine/putrescine transport system ATP-binding protein